jgi:threonine dehydratase
MKPKFVGKNVVAVISGGNINHETFARIMNGKNH